MRFMASNLFKTIKMSPAFNLANKARSNMGISSGSPINQAASTLKKTPIQDAEAKKSLGSGLFLGG